jgi:hypothetical protein
MELQAKRSLELEEQREKGKKEIQHAVAANLQIFREQHAAAGTRTHVVMVCVVIAVVNKGEAPDFPRAAHSSRHEDTCSGIFGQYSS